MKFSLFLSVSFALATMARPLAIRQVRTDANAPPAAAVLAAAVTPAAVAPASSVTSIVVVVTATTVVNLAQPTAAPAPPANTAAPAPQANKPVANAAAAKADDPSQSSTTLSPQLIQKTPDGSGGNATGQSLSLTSKNNFINFCNEKTLTDGKQAVNGSTCNGIVMGDIPAKTNIPSAKFAFPANGDTSIVANTSFVVRLNVKRMQTGVFTNSSVAFLGAPQQLNKDGEIIGHTHIVIQALPSLDSTEPRDNTQFAFFKGVDGAAKNGEVQVTVADGLPAGFYTLASINTAANHQPALVGIAQHGHLDDMVYFTVKAKGK